MGSMPIGAFEAKTHFSQLLKEVVQGNIIHVTLRGKLIAKISPEDSGNQESEQNALERMVNRGIP